MVKVPIEVSSGVARFSVAVRAGSIRRALNLVRQRYPGADVGVEFPIEPKGFFVEDVAARAGMAGYVEQPQRIAA